MVCCLNIGFYRSFIGIKVDSDWDRFHGWGWTTENTPNFRFHLHACHVMMFYAYNYKQY